MAESIDTAFAALHARLDHALAMHQRQFVRLTTALEAPETRREAFIEAVRDIGRTADWLAAHPLDQVQERQRSGRSIGDDGDDDVRLPREDGAAPGRLAAVQGDVQLADHRARESDEENPTALESFGSLHQRLAVVSVGIAHAQTHGQGMEL